MSKSEKTKSEKTKSDEMQRVVTPEFVAYFPHLFTANEYGGKKSYSITMGLKKTTDISKMKLAAKLAKIEKYGRDESEWPEAIESPFLDGDSPKFKDRIGYKGHWIVKASTGEQYKPEVIDATDGEPILNAADFYAGCIARAEVYARVWEFGDKVGVHFILNSVVKIRDGKPIGGKKPAKDAFASFIGSESEEEADFT